MYYLLTLLAAILISIMVAVNGALTSVYDIYFATVIIHVVGFISITAVVYFKKERIFKLPRLSPFAFIGGAIGVATILFNNIAFGKISISAIVALGLLGQTITSLIIDQFGLFDMPLKKFNLGKMIGLLFSICGIIYLSNGSEFVLLPILVSLLSGVTVVVSRSVNAQLSDKTSSLVSTWYNYLIGLITAIVVFLIAFGTGLSSYPNQFTLSLWRYLGGVIGVFVVLLFNISTKKMSAFYMTLLLFIGQIFTGIILDIILYQAFSMSNLIGAVFATIGLCINVWLDYRTVK
jgi:bacterial/archaeal transporter family-2 protein